MHIPLKTDTYSVSKRTLFLKIKRTLSQKKYWCKIKKNQQLFSKIFLIDFPFLWKAFHKKGYGNNLII